MTLDRILKKFQKDGIKGAAKAIGRNIHGRVFVTGYDVEVIKPILEKILALKGCITLVEVGANVGNTGSDPFYKFITQHFPQNGISEGVKNQAILIEPVRHLYEQLVANYAGFSGVKCVNMAVAETTCLKSFYSFRDGIDLAALGLPSFAHQLGSFDRANIEASCPKNTDALAQAAFFKANVVESEIQCMSLQDILRQEGIENVDLLVIDAEGYDYQILKSLDFSKLTPDYINYERTHLGKDQAACRRLLLEHGYVLYDHSDDTLGIRGQKTGIFKKLSEHFYDTWLDLIY